MTETRETPAGVRPPTAVAGATRETTDTDLIDWLENHPHGLAIRHTHEWRVPDYDHLAPNHRGATLREAIGNARRAALSTVEETRHAR